MPTAKFQPAETGRRQGHGVLSVIVNRSRHAFQLGNPKILEQAGFGIEGPIERADATLIVAGVDPVNQFLIAELVAITLAVVNVPAIDFAMP